MVNTVSRGPSGYHSALENGKPLVQLPFHKISSNLIVRAREWKEVIPGDIPGESESQGSKVPGTTDAGNSC